jgi:hypothetical protein
MTHEKLVAIANEIFAGIEERKRLSKAAADGTALDESRDAELQDFLKDMRSVVGIEAAIGMNVDPLALAEVLLRAIGRQWRPDDAT